MTSTYIRNADIVTEASRFHGGVLVEDGRIVEVVEGDPIRRARDTVDAGGLLLLPGLIDGHVHFSEPGRAHWEGFETGTRAAAAGGITTVVEMPLNASPPTINEPALRLKQAAVARNAVIDVALWGGLVDNNVDDLEDLHQGGIVGFKAFMCMSATDFPWARDDVLMTGLSKISELGTFLAVHAENEWITAALAQRLQTSGRLDRRAWGESRPAIAELEAIHRIIFWAEQTGARVHVVHVSIPEGIDMIAAAKDRGVKITCETCAHYLFFDETDLERLGPVAKCAPPLRSRATVEGLWERVLAGKVDLITSDHSPCLAEEKSVGDDDIWKAWGGISGVQSTLSAMLTAGVHQRNLDVQALVRMAAANPARLFGLYPRKGTIAAGSDADLVLVDPDASFVLSDDDLFYRNAHSAFTGSTFRGRAAWTMLRGTFVYRNGRVLGQPGGGNLLFGEGSRHAPLPSGMSLSYARP